MCDGVSRSGTSVYPRMYVRIRFLGSRNVFIASSLLELDSPPQEGVVWWEGPSYASSISPPSPSYATHSRANSTEWVKGRHHYKPPPPPPPHITQSYHNNETVDDYWPREHNEDKETIRVKVLLLGKHTTNNVIMTILALA